MRSRAELLLRLAGVGAIAAWIALALTPRHRGVASTSVESLDRQLSEWTRVADARAVHVHVDSLPDAASAAWLAALRRAGVAVTWMGEPRPLAMEVFRSSAPRGDLVVMAIGGEEAVLADALGVIDTLSQDASIRLASAEGALAMTSGSQSARVTVPRESDRRESRSLFVAGAAGWEAKFVIAALEEAGWRIDARLAVAPGKDVVQGRIRPLDTATYAAVILLDSASAETTRGVDAFVRAGGGAVLAGDANRSRRVDAIAAWRAEARELATLGTLPGDSAWRGLSRLPLTLASDRGALALEERGGAAIVVVRRHHAGRVAAVGYDETWRWRMAGGTASVADHREWWSRLVSGVAMRPQPAADAAITSAAPVAALYDALGAPSIGAQDASRSFPRDALATLLGAIALSALLAEWFLRRSRGAR